MVRKSGFGLRRSLHRGLFLLLFCLTSTLIASSAQAQNVDWLLNLDDTGFDPSPAGGTITYELSVTNDGFGPADAPATTVTVDIPANTRALGASGTITGCSPIPVDGPATITCTVPALTSNGGTATLDLDVQASQQGTLSVSASVPVAGDANAANNADTENTTVTQGADIAMDVQGPASAASGSVVTYDLITSNAGPDPVSDVVVSFPIPTGLSNIVPPAGCSLSGSTYTCIVPGPIGVGGSATISFDGQIDSAAGSTVTPLASVSPGSVPIPTHPTTRTASTPA